MASARSSEQAFLGAAALLFGASTAVTIAWCRAMATMAAMPMPGRWTMSAAWRRMPGEAWGGAAAAFIAMWLVMMTAVMLPSLTPMLSRYRGTVSWAGPAPLARLTAFAAAGYFFIWTLIGVAVYALGAALAAAEMHQPALAHAVPVAAGMIVVAAGALQFTAWKAHHRSAAGTRRDTAALCRWRRGRRGGRGCASAAIAASVV